MTSSIASGVTALAAQPLSVEHLVVEFPLQSATLLGRRATVIHAVSDVTFSVHRGEALGLVGESGSGKSTLVRALTRLIDPTAGRIRFYGHDITRARQRDLGAFRREVQMVFQDPQGSLNPRMRVGRIIATPLRLRGIAGHDADRLIRGLLDRVGLNPEHLNRFPHEFSGGQRQRVAIARALAVRPSVVMLDEPVSALDVSIQAQVVNLLKELQAELNLTYIFVSHDLAVVRHLCDRVMVMYLGKLVEIAPVDQLYTEPIHPYTSALLGASPIPDPRENRARVREVIAGEPPSQITPPAGCRFNSRCRHATEVCYTQEPPLVEYAHGHLAACHHPQNGRSSETVALPTWADG